MLAHNAEAHHNSMRQSEQRTVHGWNIPTAGWLERSGSTESCNSKEMFLCKYQDFTLSPYDWVPIWHLLKSCKYPITPHSIHFTQMITDKFSVKQIYLAVLLCDTQSNNHPKAHPSHICGTKRKNIVPVHPPICLPPENGKESEFKEYNSKKIQINQLQITAMETETRAGEIGVRKS